MQIWKMLPKTLRVLHFRSAIFGHFHTLPFPIILQWLSCEKNICIETTLPRSYVGCWLNMETLPKSGF